MQKRIDKFCVVDNFSSLDRVSEEVNNSSALVVKEVVAAVAQTVQAAVLLTPVPPPHQVYL